MVEPVKTIQHEDKVGKIFHEDFIEPDYNPRQNDNLGTMFCYHPRYELGDEQVDNDSDFAYQILKHFDILTRCNNCDLRIEYMDYGFGNWIHDGFDEDMEGSFFCEGQPIVPSMKELYSKPLYLYDHSGLSISCGFTGSSYEAWDTSMVGYIIIPKGKMIEEFPHITDKVERRAKAEEIITAECEEYDNYLRGEVYYYVVEDSDGNHIDSCHGFLGYDTVKEELHASMGKELVQ